MQTSFYERVLLEVRERQNSYQERIMTGSLSPDEYKMMAGKFLGLRESEDAVKEAYRSLFEDRIKKEEV
jgi:hypothetical protein